VQFGAERHGQLLRDAVVAHEVIFVLEEGDAAREQHGRARRRQPVRPMQNDGADGDVVGPHLEDFLRLRKRLAAGP
jgi:hypothetical protein